MCTKDDEYHYRCIDLALNGLGRVAPNPLVGCVIVYDNKIIGEGFHREYGKNHAEVNAIESIPVSEQEKLKFSTLYVNLEPCCHYGKTPPCSQLIIDKQIQKVEVSMPDPYPQVSGQGIAAIKKAKIPVNEGKNKLLVRFINRRFITFYEKKRPYIILKWAETADGFVDRLRTSNNKPPTWITDNYAHQLVHKWRTEEQAILIGTNTALLDNPQLTARYFYGKNPIRFVLDRQNRLPKSLHIFDNKIKTVVFTGMAAEQSKSENIQYVEINFDFLLEQIFEYCFQNKIQSIIVEGGPTLLNAFIKQNYWDEARVFKGEIMFNSGVKGPNFNATPFHHIHLKNSILYYYFNQDWNAVANIDYL